MYTTYVLEDKEGNFYKGVTNDPKRRLYEHRLGKTQTTSRMKELKIVYTEKYNDFKEARKRELYLKSAAGRRYLKKIIRVHSSAGRAGDS